MKKMFFMETKNSFHSVCVILMAFCMGIAVLAIIPAFPIEARGTGIISGVVVDERGPVDQARVRIQGSENVVVTDGAGRFVLSGVHAQKAFNVSAWKEGYYSALLKDVRAPKEGARLLLVRYQINDNPNYEWIPPEGAKGSCVECHPAVTAMSLNDAHLKAAVNPRFLSMYYGTDIEGKQSPPTRYEKGTAFSLWGNTTVPRRPDDSKPYYGPGFQLDFPGAVGDCSACHIPGASIGKNVDPGSVKGANRYGVHCDFCHKVGSVRLDPQSMLPFANVHGVHSMKVKRPFLDDPKRPQLFFGTFEDVNASEGDTNLPLLRESKYCAPCHYGGFWDTLVYNSYGEWLQSPYADSRSGKGRTCQECHMPSPTIYQGRPITNIAPGKGGIERNPAAIHNHNMTVDAELLRNSLTMKASVKIQNGRAVVTVTLTNDKTGHHVPTDSPLRQMILLIEAKDSRGNTLKQQDGPVLPEWCGTVKAKKNHYSGLPGKAYAKLLREKWTDVFPTGAYWNHTEMVSDNRIAAFAEDSTSFEFLPPEKGKAIITVSLLYRRAFIELMEQKKWDVPDTLMAQQKIVVMKR